MRKEKKWLKEEVFGLYPSYDVMYVSPDYEAVAKTETISKVLELIDQLDELETLSQEWIDKNKVERINNLRKMTTSDVVPVEKLKNLLISKQDKQEVEENFYTFENAKKWLHDNGFVVFEKDKLDEEIQRIVDETYEATKEKPVIPKFVAEFIETYKQRDDSLGELLGHIEWSKKGDGKPLLKVVDWVYPDNYSGVDTDGINTIARAWLDGYEVEKEKLYRVVLPTGRLDSTLVVHTDGTGHFFAGEHRNDSWYKSRLTESEIKAIDKRYLAFKEEVTE